MLRNIVSFFSGMLYAAIGVGFFSALPLPFTYVSLSLILVVNSHVRLAAREGFFLALGAGCALELLTPRAIPGEMIGLFLLINFVSLILCQKVFTHFSLLSSLSLHALAAGIWYGGIGSIAILVNYWNSETLTTHLSFYTWGGIILTHLFIALIFTFLSYRLRAWMQTIFLVRSPRDWQPLL